jgi:hypothetical protein
VTSGQGQYSGEQCRSFQDDTRNFRASLNRKVWDVYRIEGKGMVEF